MVTKRSKQKMNGKLAAHRLLVVVLVLFYLFALSIYWYKQYYTDLTLIQSTSEAISDAFSKNGFNQKTKLLPVLETVAPININTADLQTLQLLPGIGPSLAAEIIAFRGEHGTFDSVESLQLVNGIGPKILERIIFYCCV